MVENFLKEEIVINGRTYSRNDVERLKKELPGGTLDRNPFVPNMCSYTLSQPCSVNEFKNVSLVVEYNTKTNKIMDFIITGVPTAPVLANLSIK